MLGFSWVPVQRGGLIGGRILGCIVCFLPLLTCLHVWESGQQRCQCGLQLLLRLHYGIVLVHGHNIPCLHVRGGV